MSKWRMPALWWYSGLSISLEGFTAHADSNSMTAAEPNLIGVVSQVLDSFIILCSPK